MIKKLLCKKNQKPTTTNKKLQPTEIRLSNSSRNTPGQRKKKLLKKILLAAIIVFIMQGSIPIYYLILQQQLHRNLETIKKESDFIRTKNKLYHKNTDPSLLHRFNWLRINWHQFLLLHHQILLLEKNITPALQITGLKVSADKMRLTISSASNIKLKQLTEKLGTNKDLISTHMESITKNEKTFQASIIMKFKSSIWGEGVYGKNK